MHMVTQSVNSSRVDKVGKDLRFAPPSVGGLRISADHAWTSASPLTCASALGPAYFMDSISAI